MRWIAQLTSGETSTAGLDHLDSKCVVYMACSRSTNSDDPRSRTKGPSD